MKTISYATAGADTRTTQLFINYINNTRLDSLGFSPFGLNIEISLILLKRFFFKGIVTTGFDTANQIFNPTPGKKRRRISNKKKEKCIKR